MTTQIHKFHTRDTEEQLYDVPLHDVELNDVANVRHKSASSCVPSWLHGNLAHYLMLFPRKAYKHKMPAWVWICTLHGCPPHQFFLTAHNFANGPHFVALTQLRATKTGSNICCTHLSYTFSESWVRKASVGTCPEKFSRWKFSGTERFTKKFHFSLISLAVYKNKVSGSCTHNFDAIDLPNS